MSQILELSSNDIEQLATFMGHTKDIHNQVYRLPDDVYQTAKIAKLLVLMESGKAGSYKGKSLDEIEIDMEEEVVEDESDDGRQDRYRNVRTTITSNSSSPITKKM
ncbi:hypothetical protein RN001_001921 [Aquatica leii]|uniref:Uncharacterized protein n=1 Tax=Aquatica leii TaxID=1421715 RepID=A0AAN7QAR5_9COLE|nr:hypothetical protein RN001_001921 [Aquatica leii]